MSLLLKEMMIHFNDHENNNLVDEMEKVEEIIYYTQTEIEIETLIYNITLKQLQKINEKIPLLSIAEKKNNNKLFVKVLNSIILKKHIKLFKTINKKKVNKYKYESLFPILYIIRVIVLAKNTILQVTNIKGDIILSCSASSSLKLRGKQLTLQPKVLFSLFKYFLKRIKFLENKKRDGKLFVALHSKSIKENLLKLILKKLKKKKVYIKIINYFNFFPHNGCRPEKIRRLKRKKKTIHTKKHFNTTKKLWKFVIRQRLRKGMLSKYTTKI
jgi:ribosomal protein S11